MESRLRSITGWAGEFSNIKFIVYLGNAGKFTFYCTVVNHIRVQLAQKLYRVGFRRRVAALTRASSIESDCIVPTL